MGTFFLDLRRRDASFPSFVELVQICASPSFLNRQFILFVVIANAVQTVAIQVIAERPNNRIHHADPFFRETVNKRLARKIGKQPINPKGPEQIPVSPTGSRWSREFTRT